MSYIKDVGQLPSPGFGKYEYGGWGGRIALDTYPEVALCQAIEEIRAGEAGLRELDLDPPHYPDSFDTSRRIPSEYDLEAWDQPPSVRDYGIIKLINLLDRHHSPAIVAALEFDREEASLKLAPRFRYFALRSVERAGLAEAWHLALFKETGRQLSPAWAERLDGWELSGKWEGRKLQDDTGLW